MVRQKCLRAMQPATDSGEAAIGPRKTWSGALACWGCYYPVHRTFYYVHPITLLFCTPLSYFVIGRLFRVRLPISQITNLRAEIKLFPSLH